MPKASAFGLYHSITIPGCDTALLCAEIVILPRTSSCSPITQTARRAVDGIASANPDDAVVCVHWVLRCALRVSISAIGAEVRGVVNCYVRDDLPRPQVDWR